VNDEKNVLGGIRTVAWEGKEVEGFDGMVRANGFGPICRLPDPRPEDQAVFMDPRGTTRFFLTYLKTLNKRWNEVAQGWFDPSAVNHVAAHHPSILIHRKARKLWGFDERQMPFIEKHRNAPACTFGMEMKRIVPDLNEGETLMMIFFGAGAAGEARLLRVR